MPNKLRREPRKWKEINLSSRVGTRRNGHASRPRVNNLDHLRTFLLAFVLDSLLLVLCMPTAPFVPVLASFPPPPSLLLMSDRVRSISHLPLMGVGRCAERENRRAST